MWFVDIIFYPRYTHENTVFLKLIVRETDISSEFDAPPDVYPIFFRPYPVNLPRESEFQVFIIKQVFYSRPEHIP